MLSFLPGPLLLLINLTLFAIDAIVLGSLVVLLGIVRFILPFKPVIKVIEKIDYLMFFVWSINTKYIILLTNKVQYHISGDKPLGPSKPCIVISNHKSWIDILMLHSVFEAKIPLTKFFMKKNLIYVPFIGLACYALGMPFLRRYPKEKILKTPELRMKDINNAIKDRKNLILVDEIFKGTNASERIDASFKVIDKLNSYNQFFIISTHDFELYNANNILNYHFNETYIDDKISFDYKIKDGKSETKNAIYLLKMANIIE